MRSQGVCLCEVTGRLSEVTGHLCEVTGRLSEVTGHLCEVTGHLCEVTGRLCEVTGHLSEVTGRLSSDILCSVMPSSPTPVATNVESSYSFLRLKDIPLRTYTVLSFLCLCI